MRYCLVNEAAVKREAEAQYYSRGQKFLFEQAMQDEDGSVKLEVAAEDEWEGEEDTRLRASG